MIAPIPENQKKAGVCYAVADDGLELPVIDVTHPAFAFELSEEDLSALIDRFVLSMQTAAKLPPAALAAMAQQSRLMRGLVAADGGCTSGMVTYLNKLGPNNLGEGWATPVDRQWAASLTPLTFQWRMRDVARLLADGVVPALAARPGLPLHLLNIGGGPGADSWNALILLHKEQPALLAGRQVTIHVLDVDAEGPHFGAQSLAALTEPGAPLDGVAADLVHVPYDWAETARLAQLLDNLRAAAAVVSVSSEGGLFEYATDEQIVANLAVLHDCAPADCVVVGPVVRDESTLDERLKASEHAPGRPGIRYLGLVKFAQLAARSGWRIECSADSPMHQVVRLGKTEPVT
jgi:hypothetical protein